MSFSYNLSMALRSIRRSLGMSVLMIVSVGFGVAAAMTTLAVFKAVSGDPIPWKSSKLFVPQIDFWGPRAAQSNKGEPPAGLDYTDAAALWRDHRATAQSPMYQIVPWVMRNDGGDVPISVVGHAVVNEFFPMLDLPFVAGSAWSAEDDARGAAVAVISRRLSEKLFGCQDAVGRLINISGKTYQIKGVLGQWHPQPRYYDLFNTGGFTTAQDELFIPFQRAIDVGMSNIGSLACRTNPSGRAIKDLMGSNCAWISYMVQLDSRAAMQRFDEYLNNYASQQRAIGRFDWAPNNRLRDLPAWLDYRKVVPRETKMSMVVAFGLLLACLASTAGLLLSQFLRRRSEIGIRRALGAPRKAIYGQFLTEAGVIGCAGGVLGLGLTFTGLAGLPYILPEGVAALVHLNPSLTLGTLVLAIVSTLAAAFYPITLVSRTETSWQIDAI
jgi:putative ABC transport system permease protein